MTISNILWTGIIISLLGIFIFIFKELWRNKDNELREVFKKNSKKNINNLFGISKETFLTMLVNLVIISIAFLSLLETSNQNKETSLINERTLRMFEIENRPYISLRPTKFEDTDKYIKVGGTSTEQSISIRFELKNSGHIPAKNLTLKSITIPRINLTKDGVTPFQTLGPIQASLPGIKSSLGSGEITKFEVQFFLSGVGIDGKATQFELESNINNFLNNKSSIPVEAIFSYNSEIDPSIEYKNSVSAIVKSDSISILNQE